MVRVPWISCLLVLAVAACQKQQPYAPQNQAMTVDENGAGGEILANAEIETLPPDESSVTSNGELVEGSDNPDVNEVGNGH